MKAMPKIKAIHTRKRYTPSNTSTNRAVGIATLTGIAQASIINKNETFEKKVELTEQEIEKNQQELEDKLDEQVKLKKEAYELCHERLENHWKSEVGEPFSENAAFLAD